MSAPCVIGVDPGGKGALALYQPQLVITPTPPGVRDVILRPGARLMLWDMPSKKVPAAKGKEKVVLDLQKLRDLAQFLVTVYEPQRVIIEQVAGMAGQGSGFSFGWNTCAVHMAFVCFGKTPETVTPSKWKKAAEVPKEKKDAVGRADVVFPDYRDLFRVPHARNKNQIVVRPDRAEAALIAWWGVQYG